MLDYIAADRSFGTWRLGEAVKKMTFSTDVLPHGLDEWKGRTLWHDLYVEVIGPCDLSFLPDKPLLVEFQYLPVNEVSYFNRCFRRRFGASPTEYRGAGGEIQD